MGARTITDAAAGEALLRRLGPVVGIRRALPETRTARRFDTFDLRLHQQGLVLEAEAGEARLTRRKTGEIVAAAPAKLADRLWAADLPAALRDHVCGPAKMRRLLALASTATERRPFRVENDDRKTIARGAIESVTVGARALAHRFVLHPLRGYADDVERLLRLVEEAQPGMPRHPEPLLLAALRADGHDPSLRLSGVAPDLTAAATAQEAVARILRHLAARVAIQFDGVRDDLDTEFLHDLRVGVRKSRAVLRLTRGILPKRASEALRGELGDFARATNALRDLDVYLLEADSFRALVPAALRGGLDPLFTRLRRERAAARVVAVDAIDALGPGVLANVQALTDRVIARRTACRGAAKAPAIDLARSTIWTQFKRVRKRGRAIRPDTPDAPVHELRIHAKRLRYAIDGFRSLLPADATQNALSALKRLQNVLGAFNDRSVQSEWIAARLPTLKAKGKGALAQAAALGGLLAVVTHEKRRARGRFEVAFERFLRLSPTFTNHFRPS